MQSTLLIALTIATQNFNLPDKLLTAVCFVESSLQSHVINKDDGNESSIGLCQVHLSTAKWLGYKGTEKGLLNPKTNAYYAAKYLRYQLDRYDEDIPASLAAYNAGSCKHNDDGQIKNRKYIKKVYKAWRNDVY